MSNTEFRTKMVAALDATGADGASITGTESEVSITLTFKREVSNGCSDGSACCRSSVVASEVDNAGRNMELPQSDTEVAPARRMWKRWAIEKEYGECGEVLWTRQERALKYGLDANPVTILPGHDAVEQIELAAYERGKRDGIAEVRPYIEEEKSRLRTLYEVPDAIDGVEPVVVDGFTFAERRLVFPWDCDSEIAQLNVWRNEDDQTPTPVRIHMYLGVGSDGKKVQP